MNEEEQVLNLQAHVALVTDKSKKGKAALAKSIKAHCELHDQSMESPSPLCRRSCSLEL